MKNLQGIATVLVVFWAMTSSCTTGTLQSDGPQDDTFDQLERQFADPGKEYGSAPLWVWNTEVDSAIISEMMADFVDKGFGGVFIHPRPGLITEYLSETWNDLCGYVLAQGQELGLDVWIYDENSYPSGFAGGHVPAEMPESYNQGQMLHLDKHSTLPDDAHKYFICLRKEQNGFVEVTGRYEAESGRQGDYYCFEKESYRRSSWYGGYSYVDLLVPGVTEKFIELTMEGYEKVMGNAFGKTVPGVFTDEPNIEVQGSGNIRWTPDLFGTFEKTWGYDLRKHLPSLFEEIGDWNKVRHNYYQVLLQLFIDRWSKPWYAYTEENGLEWTGHYWEHGWPNPNHGGDNMAMYAWHQRPAIDMLFNQYDEGRANAQFGNIRAVKELSSVANQLGRRRTLSETYGGGGWELTFMDMKRLGDWEYVLGVNTLNQHLSYMTIKGARKYDYPPSFTYHSPWWPYYRDLNRYFARLSLALSTGVEAGDILVIEPTTSAWMYAARSNPHRRMAEIGEAFQSFVTTLEKAQVHYDLGSENIIKDHGLVEGSSLIVGKKIYRTIVLAPGTENLDDATVDLLSTYVDNGGKVVVFETPTHVDGAPSEAVDALLAGGDHVAFPAGSLPAAIDAHFRDEDATFIDTEGGNLYHMRRKLRDGHLVFLSNADMAETHHGRYRIAAGDALLLDLFSGDVYAYPYRREGDRITIDYKLYPAGSMLLFFPEKPVDGFERYESLPDATSPIPSGATTVERMRPNVLTVDFCDVQIGATMLKDLHVYNAADTVYKHHGFVDGNPWNHSIQYRKTILRRDTLGDGTGFSVAYDFEVDKGVDLSSLRLAAEERGMWRVKINGSTVVPEKGVWWLDRALSVYNIGDLTKHGTNTIEMSIERMRVHAEIEPVYILGDFALTPLPQGWKIAPPERLEIGDWVDQGYPLYGFEVAYRKSFEREGEQKYFVKLGRWKGTVAHVRVNGQPVGNIMAPPNMLEITKAVREGANTVEVIVVGSLKNTLGPHHNEPEPGLVSPWRWRRIETPTPGDEYDLYSYGLMEDFQVVASNATVQ